MMNTSNLNESRISNMASNRDLLDMDLSKIREFMYFLPLIKKIIRRTSN